MWNYFLLGPLSVLKLVDPGGFRMRIWAGTDEPQWSIGIKNSSVEPPTDLLSGEAIRTVWGGGHV